MALEIGENISQWTTTRLVRFVKDLFEKDPPLSIGSTTIENLRVSEKLIVSDEIVFSRDFYFHEVGKPGEPAFANSWVNFGGSTNTAGFWKDPFDFVHLKGTIKTGTVGNAAFTLPAGYRPVKTEILDVISNNAIGRVDIASDGTVTPVSPSNNTFVSLDGKSFRAAPMLN